MAYQVGSRMVAFAVGGSNPNSGMQPTAFGRG